jgi:hypothetical protein
MSETLYHLLAEVTVLVHFLFVLFVAGGALLLLRWPKLVYLHLPALAWGLYIEFTGAICPLTPLENHLRHMAGMETYEGGFINQYLMPVLYPAGLTKNVQLILGGLMVLVNGAIYGVLIWRRFAARAD